MKGKKLLTVIVGVLVVVVVAGAALVGCAPEAAPTPKPTPTPTPTPTPEWEGATWRMANPWPPPEVNPLSRILLMWCEEVTARTDGKMQWEYFWGGALGKGPEHFTLVSDRVVETVGSYAWYTPGKLPLQRIEYTFPFAPTDSWIAYQAQRDLIKEFPVFDENLAKYNIKRLFDVSPTVYSIQTRVPVNTLSDMEGLKIGAIGGYFGRWLEASGAASVVTPGYERYTMLETGVLDGTLDPTAFTDSLKNYEVAPYSLENWMCSNPFDSLWVNMDAFNELPPDIQVILEEAAIDIAEDVSQNYVEAWDMEIFDRWKNELGIKFTRLSDQEMAEWAMSCPDTAAEWAQDVEDQGYPGFEIGRRYQELTTQYGWEWPKQWCVKQ